MWGNISSRDILKHVHQTPTSWTAERRWGLRWRRWMLTKPFHRCPLDEGKKVLRCQNRDEAASIIPSPYLRILFHLFGWASPSAYLVRLHLPATLRIATSRPNNHSPSGKYSCSRFSRYTETRFMGSSNPQRWTSGTEGLSRDFSIVSISRSSLYIFFLDASQLVHQSIPPLSIFVSCP